MRLWFALLLALANCHPSPSKPAPGEVPPLPPASGTAVGYLVDAAGELQLRDDQVTKLKDIDTSLAAENGQIDAQLRQIEKPVPAEEVSPQDQKAGVKPQRYNNAPGASTITTTDSQKLRKMRDDNDRDALIKAFKVLDAEQLTKAKQILADRGIAIPGEAKQEQTHDPEDGKPLPGMEP
ncbi:MAG TPA: hypothetical protein VFV99_17710 [Kofleriaceae bacterium]|nr:hypothetical protein [Kofleriaceae bacterium]